MNEVNCSESERSDSTTLLCVFSKKFKVRVKYFANCKYTVDYAHYRLIPIWRSLSFWFEQGHPGGTECWTTDLFKVGEAERIAKTLNSVDDVNKFYESRIKKEKKWRENEKEYLKRNTPYQSRQINT